jgi:hypothetical protein
VSAIETLTEIYRKYLYSLLYPFFIYDAFRCPVISSIALISWHHTSHFLSLFFFLTSIARATSVDIMNMLWVGQLRSSDLIHSRGNRYGSSVALARTIP